MNCPRRTVTFDTIREELTKAQQRKDAGTNHRVPGFRQRGHHLNLAREKQQWAVTWRSDLIKEMVRAGAGEAVVTDVEVWVKARSPVKFHFKVFDFGDTRVAVMPRSSSHPDRFNVKTVSWHPREIFA